MYKLFLVLRYLRYRYLAWIAALSVALCVWMVLVTVSVMDGFLRKVETAAKGLFGDIVMESGLAGIGRYDEFIDYLRGSVPEVQAATPVIWSYGLLRVGDSFTDTVGICGIRLPERLAVTDFGAGLWVQANRPEASFDPPLERLIAATRAHLALIRSVRERELSLPPGRQDQERLDKLAYALGNCARMLDDLEAALGSQRRQEQLRAAISAQRAKPPDQRDGAKLEEMSAELAGLADAVRNTQKRLSQAQLELADEDAKGAAKDQVRLEELSARVKALSVELDRQVRPPEDRLILGLGMTGLSFRTPEGESIRLVSPGRNVVLSLLPIGRGFSTTITPNTRTLTVVDDARTDVSTIDSKTVYVPFDTLQALADMGAQKDDAGRTVKPARCSQIQIKVRPEFAGDRKLVPVRQKVQQAWRQFAKDHEDAVQPKSNVAVHTWRERLDKFIGPIAKQRTLVVMMFGIISFVAVLLIFAIFYTLIMQKIRDIGIVRAVGGSPAGVAWVFLVFGAVTGLAGSLVGVIIGWLTVHYINQIQDWLAAWLGFRVWDRDVFMFDKIPNQVDPAVAALIVLWAIASGLVGALIPSVRAAVMEPVEAIRYE